MNLINLINVSKSFTERKLFHEVSLGINEGDRVGIIGVNGTGKSTLMKLIAGMMEPDSGNVVRGKDLKISYLPQSPEFSDSSDLLDNVVRGLVHPDSFRDIKGEATAMLRRFQIPDPSVRPSCLSGGQRKRAALVRSLLMPADVLLLDEPTNHLDAAMTEWLSQYLCKNGKALVMITHDRYFLDSVTNRIVELDQTKLYAYKENYTGFLLLKAEREAMQDASERKAASVYRTELAWMMRGARARSTKQKAHIERFEALENRDRIVRNGSVEISAGSSRLGRKTIEVENLTKAYSGKFCIKDFSYIFLSTDRIGIIGPNGSGKTTFVKLITGLLSPDSGSVTIGQTIKIGYFMQENESLDLSKRVIDSVRDVAEFIATPDGTITASKMCEKFLFTDELQYTVIGKLSGGEKRRLALLHVLMQAPNVLILDEPTNDLDIATLSILEDYLLTFPGIILAVSHDRYFLDRIANRIFSFEGDGKIRRYEGNYSDYHAVCEKEGSLSAGASLFERKAAEKPEEASRNPEQKGTEKPREKKLKFSYAEQREFASIEETITNLEAAVSELEKEIEAAATDFTRLTALTEQKEKTESELSEKMERWMYLTDLYEKINA